MSKKTKRASCKNCGKEVKWRSSIYCSRVCHKEHINTLWIKDWLAGRHDGVRGELSTSTRIRNYMFKIKNSKCELCGWSEINPYTGLIPLELEHVDGNHKNNRPENLQLLCPNCHSLTATYKALNKGSGRAARKQLSTKEN